MKSAKKKSLLNKAKRGEKQHDAVTVKTEYEAQLDGEGEEDVKEGYINGDGLNIQIKEEPHSQEISEEYREEDTSSGFDTKPDTGSLKPDIDHQQGHLKEEPDSDPQPESEVTAGYQAAVKEESDSWIKEERDCAEEEAEDAANIQEDNGEQEQICTGRNQ